MEWIQKSLRRLWKKQAISNKNYYRIVEDDSRIERRRREREKNAYLVRRSREISPVFSTNPTPTRPHPPYGWELCKVEDRSGIWYPQVTPEVTTYPQYQSNGWPNMWARIQYDRWNEEVERQKLKTEVGQISEKKNEEMKNKKENSTVTESDVAKEREALREDYETLFIVAKSTY